MLGWIVPCIRLRVDGKIFIAYNHLSDTTSPLEIPVWHLGATGAFMKARVRLEGHWIHDMVCYLSHFWNWKIHSISFSSTGYPIQFGLWFPSDIPQSSAWQGGWLGINSPSTGNQSSQQQAERESTWLSCSLFACWFCRVQTWVFGFLFSLFFSASLPSWFFSFSGRFCL